MSDISLFTTAAKVLVVIDSGVKDFQLLAQAVMSGAALLVLEPHRDGIRQITEAQQRYGANILHIVSHGAPGCLYLGNTELSLDTLDRYTEQVNQWFETSQEAELILYGCNVAAGDAGSEFLDYLHRLTGANIAASTNLTGHQALGGDWVLERAIGAIHAPLAFHPDALEHYPSVLSHFGSGTLGWESEGGNTVTFKGFQTVRGVFFAPTPKVGDVYTLSTINFGDGTTAPLNIRVIQYSASSGLAICEIGSGSTAATFQAGIQHTYATTGNYTAFFDDGNRLVNLKNNADGTIRMETVVNIGSGNSAPETSFPSGFQVIDNTLHKVFIPATDADGDQLRFRLATNAESKSGQPTGFSINATTGEITFNSLDPSRATVAGDRWNGQVIIEDLDASGNAKSKISLDFVILISGTNQSPSASAGGPYNVREGGSLPLSGTGVDPDGFILDREWDFNYDGVTFDVDATGAFPKYSAPLGSAGTTRTVAFRVRDTLGAVSPIVTTTVNIVNPAIAPSSLPDMTAATDLGISNTDDITSNRRPTFVGTAEPNSTIKIYAGRVLLGSTTSNAAGAWTFTPSTNLVDGNYDITDVAFLSDGSISTPSPLLPITIDGTAPVASSVPDLTAATDTGVSNTDNNTRNNQPTFTGTAEKNSKVEVFAGALSLGTTITDALGNWTLNVGTALAEGTYNVTAIVTDVAGNVSPASGAISVTIDTTPPAPTAPSTPDLTAATDTGVSNTDDLTGNNKPTFVGTGTANSTVELFAGTTSLGTAPTDATGNWTLNVAVPMPNGTYNFTAVLLDIAGNAGPASGALPVTINAPAIPSTPDLTAATDTGASNTDNLTNNNKPTFTGTATANQTVELFAGTTSLGTTTVDGAGVWTLNVTTVIPDGTYSITAIAKDAEGNTSIVSSPLSVTIDTVGLTTTPSAPDLTAVTDTGVLNTDNNTSNNQPTFTGTATANSTVEVFAGILSLGTVTADAAGAWTLNVATMIPDGAYSVTVAEKDTAGNLGPASTALSVTIDTTPPAPPSNVDMTAASDNGASSTDNTTTITTPTFTGKAEPNSTVQLYDAAAIQIGTALANSSGDWTFTFATPLSPGSYVIKARAVDKAGNISSVPLTHVDDHVEFDIVAPASTPTALKLDDASNSSSKADTITNDDTPTITGKATSGSNVELRDGTTVLGTTVADPITGLWSYTPTAALAEGDRPITAYEIDATGSYSSPAALTITIDKTPPAAPTNLDLVDASDDGVSSTDNITSDNTPTITGKAEANSSVELFSGTASLGTVTTNGSGDWTFTPSNPLLVGPYSITTKATDAAGNTGAASAPLSLTITAPPGVPFNLNLVDASDTGASNTDNLTQDNTPTVTGKADPNTTVVVLDGTTTLGEAIANASGDWTFTPLSPLADGVHPFSAKQKDGAGNLGTAAAPLNITIDNAAPAAPTTAPNLIDSSDTGTSNTDNITGDNTPTFDGAVPLNTAMVELFAGTTSLGKAPVDASGKWSFTPTTALADNTYSVTVKAIDAAGNTSLASPPLSVTIDALPPKVTFTPIQTNDTTPALTGNIDDPNAVVEVKINGVTYLATNKGDGTWFIPDNTIAPLTDGGFDILVTAKDKQGNSATDNGGGDGTGGTTKALTIDGTAPTGAILTIAPTPNGVNTVSIQFTEPVTNFDVSDLQLTRNTSGADEPVSLAGAKLASSDGGKTWALTNIAGITNLTGDYKLTLNRSDIKDLAGNGIVADATSAFSLVDDCVFGIALTVPKIKGRKGTKQNGNSSGNSLRGSNGKDKLRGLNGADYMVGGGGSDRLTGGKGKDRVVGGRGRDRVVGGGGNDKVKGGGGKDMLTGSGGKDMLAGNNGPDILTGGAKKDILKGGKGKDMFVFSGLASEGNDLIKRFQTQQDVIDLRPIFARTEFTGITPDAKFHQYIQTVQVGANTQVKVDLDGAGSGTTFGAIATLRNINASTINCSSFVVA